MATDDDRDAPPRKRRLFLAVNLSLAATRRVADFVTRVSQGAREQQLRASWVPAANLHVTLKFLGWAAAEAMDPIRDVVLGGVRARKGFEISARGVGAFPSESAARVLWVGVADPTGGLAKLAADAETWMQGLGFAKDPRPFAPHLTIARTKDESGRDVAPLFAPHRQVDFGPSLVREVVLYESVTGGKGTEYHALARMGLDVPPFRAEKQDRGGGDGGSGGREDDGASDGDGANS